MWTYNTIALACFMLLPSIVFAVGGNTMNVGESVSGFVTVRLMETQAIEMTEAIIHDYVMACDQFFEENTNDEIVNLNVRLFHSSVPTGQRRRLVRQRQQQEETMTSSSSASSQILDTTLLLTGTWKSSSSATTQEEWEDRLPSIINQNTTGFLAITKNPKYIESQTFFEPLGRVEAYSAKQIPSVQQEGGTASSYKGQSANQSVEVAVITSIVSLVVLAVGILMLRDRQRRRVNAMINATKKNITLPETILPEQDPAITTAVAA